MSANTKSVTVQWNGDKEFIASAPDGTTVRMSPTGLTPTEMVLVGLAGCTGMDVIDILHKKRQPVKSLELRVTGEQAEEHPHRFTHISITYVLKGEGLEAAAVQRAIELSETKYCSVAATLRGITAIETRFEIDSSPTQ